MSRYARQTVLPGFGAEGQARLAGARVLVVGAGGLGVPVLSYLAGAGIGRITLVDPDRVEEVNLHRQPLYRAGDIGRPKAEAARDSLAALNPETRVRPVVDWLDPATAPALVADADLAIDCADSFAVSYVLSDCCAASERPLISASALAFGGYAGGFCGPAPSLRAVFPDLPARAGNCAAAGIAGPVVGMLGALEAQMALSVLLGLSPSPLGQVVTLDAENWRMSGFRFEGAPEPGDSLHFLARAQFSPDDLVIDLRGPEEAPTPVTPGAMRLLPEDLSRLPDPLPREGRVVLCCRSGLRAWRAARLLQARWPGAVALAALGDRS